MGIRLPSHLPWVLDLLELEWPNIDEGEFEAAAIGHRWIAALTDEAAADAHGGAQTVAEANEGRSVEAFASYWCRGAVYRIDQLTETLSVAESAQYAMADHVTAVKSAVIWELEGLLDEIYRATSPVDRHGAMFSQERLRQMPAVQWTRENVQSRLGQLEDLLASEAVRLRTAWHSGGSGLSRPRLATTWQYNVLAFEASSYDYGARRIAHASDSMDLTGHKFGAARGRSAAQLRQWPPAIWAAGTLDDIETDFADLIRKCAIELQITSDSLLACRTTLLEAECRNIELAYRAQAAAFWGAREARNQGTEAVSEQATQLSVLLNGQPGPQTWSWVSEDPFTGFQQGLPE